MNGTTKPLDPHTLQFAAIFARRAVERETRSDRHHPVERDGTRFVWWNWKHGWGFP